VGSRHAYKLLGPLLRGSPDLWRSYVLQNHSLDAGLGNLVNKAMGAGWLVEILSDGFDFYIELLLEKAGLSLPVRSSALKMMPTRFEVASPFMNPLCGRCGTCKSERILELSNSGYYVIFVGDGLSDMCAAPKAHKIWAKDVLAEHLDAKGVPFERYGTLEDIAAKLFAAGA